MTDETKTIWTSTGGITYVDDLVSALQEAEEAAQYEDDKVNGDSVFFYVMDQDGAPIDKVTVTEDTLSDGSKAFTVVVHKDPNF